MPAATQPFAPAEGDLELAVDQAIEACGGDAREAVKALVAVDFLEAQVDELKGGGVERLCARPLRRATPSQGVAMDVTYYVALPFVMADERGRAWRGGRVPQRQCRRHARRSAVAEARLRRRGRLLADR